MVSGPAAEFSILLPGWLSSLCTERLANNLSAPVGYEASMSTTGPVFLRPAMEIRERGWSGHSAGKRGGGGKRKQGKEGGIPGSRSGRNCISVFCDSHGRVGLTEGALVAYYVCQPQHINTGTKAQSTLTCDSIYFFTSGHMCGVPLMQRTSMFSQSEGCCATESLQVIRLTRGNLQTNTRKMVSGLQDKTCFFRFWVNQNIRTKKTISAFTQVDSPLLSVVQTALCYTMYLLPTQLQEAPPSLHHQQNNTSEISHLMASSSS